MQIKFKQTSDISVDIMCGEQKIGNIFTPSGTLHELSNAIQVCGFDDAFQFWGCGVYSDGKGSPKKDIQLLFSENSTREGVGIDFNNGQCGRCFFQKKDCRCKDLRVKDIKELVVEKIAEGIDE